jgi:hypothetical protein
MRRIRRVVPMLGLAAVIATLVVASSTTGAAAYGAADHPIAQVEISGNCDNPSYPFCANVVGTGGIWLWIELDANHTGDVSGAECGHTVGGAGGPGGAGAGPIKGNVSWFYSPTPIGVNVLDAIDPTDTHGVTNWYVIVLPGGTQPPFSVPVQTGHYSWHPTSGVSLQTTVAP